MMQNIELDNLLRRALAEDIGMGDITSESCIPADTRAEARIVAKEPGVICGIDLVARTFKLLDENVCVKPHVVDGDRVETGAVLVQLTGCARSILTGERTVLNLLAHLSGIATKTADAVMQIADTRAKICDTRKTTPGLRALEKYAVRTGGAVNHRFGLFDGVLIKDNHIANAGGIENAVRAARARVPHTLNIEVETENLAQVREALDAGADIIMLDNMDVPTMREAVALIGGRAITEASGNMGVRPLREVAETGVDFISIGALTHSVRAMDISMKINER